MIEFDEIIAKMKNDLRDFKELAESHARNSVRYREESLYWKKRYEESAQAHRSEIESLNKIYVNLFDRAVRRLKQDGSDPAIALLAAEVEAMAPVRVSSAPSSSAAGSARS